MDTHDHRRDDPYDEKEGERPAPQGADDVCRCKQVSIMTTRELFGTMWRDLAFWKKTAKKKR